MNLLTPSQQAALGARGNVLVVAGAGTGKTRTLVERCCSLLLEKNASLDEILMVTFTDAAAADMRRKVRMRLMEHLGMAPGDSHLAEQLALLDTASISTLHSFCLKLAREHFHHARLQLDPEFVVLTEEQLHPLRHQALDALLESHYGGDSAEARAFQHLVTEQARGAEWRVRELIWRLQRYARSLADPSGWFDRQLAAFAQPEPGQWREWFAAGFAEWRQASLDELQSFADNPIAGACRNALSDLPAVPSREQIAGALAVIHKADEGNWPHGSKTKVRNRLKAFFEGAEFLRALTPAADGEDPLAQDWGWARTHMGTLLRLAREFGDQFDRAKRELGGVDFADLEQFALRLLWDAPAGRPTPIALQWRARLKFVFVDEYQDINEAQDTILRALSREGAAANRFLVGDIKQSIYRFRLADPTIFRHYQRDWGRNAERGRTIPLSDNFRSREALLDFINPLFTSLMRAEIGGVTYDSDAHLRFGGPDQRTACTRAKDPAPQVEIHLRVKGGEGEAPDRDDDPPDRKAWVELADLDAAEKEARLVALRLRALRDEKHQVWDDERRTFRNVEWGDMVVLLRAPTNKVERFAQEFSRASVPLHAPRGGFYDTTEISDLLSLLQLLDNPLQDLPLLAVLRSPLVGLSLDELAVIRATRRDGHFWAALQQFCLTSPPRAGDVAEIAAGARPRAKAFLDSFASWRQQARRGALSDCVETVMAETHYDSLLLAQPRGEERMANVNRLLNLIRQFDPYQREGLLRFLKFVEAQRDAEVEESRDGRTPPTTDAVRLMSIHQSKGLEFPVVVIADLGKSFNLSNLRADILLDREYGLCPQIAPPDRAGHYASLPYWLARRRQLAEELGEELRLFYVALTRARDRLILAGTMTNPTAVDSWRRGSSTGTIATREVLSARSYLAWLQLWLPQVAMPGDWTDANGGENGLVRWTLYSENDARLLQERERGAGAGPRSSDEMPAPTVAPENMVRRLTWQYPFAFATQRAAKTSVTALRRQAAELLDGEAWQPFAPRGGKVVRRGEGELSAADIGTAHHTFLQHVSLAQVGGMPALKAEARRLEAERVLSADDVAVLDFGALAAFWKSEAGRRIRVQGEGVRRELAFTARFDARELAAFTGDAAAPGLENEFVVVQGVADLVVLSPKEIWLLDFKTDEATADTLSSKVRLYKPQLELYALALGRIYARPVTECWLHFLSCRKTVRLAP